MVLTWGILSSFSSTFDIFRCDDIEGKPLLVDKSKYCIYSLIHWIGSYICVLPSCMGKLTSLGGYLRGRMGAYMSSSSSTALVILKGTN